MRKLLGVLLVLLVALPASSAFGQSGAWEIKYLGNVAPDTFGSCGVWNASSFRWQVVAGNPLLGAVVDDPEAIDGKAYRVDDNSDADRLLWRTSSENIGSNTGGTVVARVKKVSDTNGSGNIGFYEGAAITAAYHWGGPTGRVWEPYRNVEGWATGDADYHILRLAVAGNGANPPYAEPFAYANGALSGINDWSGGSVAIRVESESVQITGGAGSADCIAPVYARADANGIISVKIKVKRGTGGGYHMYSFYVLDSAGARMAWWYGKADTIKPRRDGATIGPEQVLTDDLFHQTEVKIYPYTNTVEYYFEPVAGSGVMTLLSTWTYTSTDFGNELGQIKFNRSDNFNAAGQTIYFDDLEVGGAPVPGVGRRVKLYLDEDPTPVVAINNAFKISVSPDAFIMGCMDLAGTEDVYFDWIVGSAAGAFAPGEEEGVIGHSLLIDPTVVTTIAAAKKAPEHAQAELAEVSVTSIIKSYDEFSNVVPVGFTAADYRDVNPTDPFSPIYKAAQGIRVVYNPDFGIGFYQGEHVKISGTCETIDGERVVVANYVEEVLTMDPQLVPQAVNNKMSGGGAFGMQAALVGDVARLTGLPSYEEPFTYADGALVGKGFWSGSAGSEIGVSGNQLTITSPGAAKNAVQSGVWGDCGTGEISMKIKAKAGSGASNFWTLGVSDPAGLVFGYWMGSATFVRGRMADGTYTPEQSLDANWKTLEIKVYPSMDATEFLVDGVRLGNIFDHSIIGCGDTVGSVSFDRLQVDTTNQIPLDDLQVLPGSATDTGLNDVGMYTTIFGRVTNVVVDPDPTKPWNSYFYVNDGSNLNDGTGNVGIRCRPCSGDFIETYMPPVGDYVSLIGTMGVTNVAGNSVRFFYTWSFKAY